MTCKKCNGTGWYPFDRPHHETKSKCDACCTHSKGWWQLTEGYASYKEGEDNACCVNGCGTLRRDLPEEKAEPF
jgi:hypothetical protein